MKPAPHPLAAEARPVSARDLAWLLASLALVVAPHMLRAPWWLTLFTLCLYAWRLYYSVNRAPLPSRWLVLAVGAIAMLGLWVEFRSLTGGPPSITNQETSQPNLQDLIYWASGLEPIYLEGAFARAAAA